VSEGPAPPGQVTGLLAAWSAGDRAALDRLVPLVERELHAMARRHLRRERPGHTLQATALVNEAYLRILEQQQVPFHGRGQFFAIAARLMRRILIDHARRRGYAKRGGGAPALPLDEAFVVGEERAAELLALDDALSLLSSVDERKARIVELRFFGGLSVDETAAMLDVHPDTVNRDWQRAKAFLRRELAAR
jgi:RNA polymerase sigma-70 factor, ECF subfamily